MLQAVINHKNSSEQTELLNEELRNLIPVSKFNDYYDFPKVGAIRQYIYYNRDNFRDLVVINCGNRQYINVLALVKWLKTSKSNLA